MSRSQFTLKDFNTVKRLLNEGKTVKTIGYLTGKSDHSVSYTRKAKDFDDYNRIASEYWQKRKTRIRGEESAAESQSFKRIDPETGLILVKISDQWIEEYLLERYIKSRKAAGLND